MKQIIEVTGEGFEAFLGEQVILFCANYFYAGKLVGVNETFVKLEEGKIVYETGPFTDGVWKNAEVVGGPVYVRIAMIEGWAKGK